MPSSESENAEEQFLPTHYELWKSNPEQVFGKQEIHRLVEEAFKRCPRLIARHSCCGMWRG